MIKEDPYISTSKMAEIIGVDRRNIARNIKKLQEQGVVRRVGPDKGGFWEVIELLLSGKTQNNIKTCPEAQ